MGDAIVSGSGTQHVLVVDEEGSGRVNNTVLLTQAIAVNASNLSEYIGWTYAGSGTATSSAIWRIQKIGYDSNSMVSGIGWADGSIEFNKVWANRATYTYG